MNINKQIREAGCVRCTVVWEINDSFRVFPVDEIESFHNTNIHREDILLTMDAYDREKSQLGHNWYPRLDKFVRGYFPQKPFKF